VALLVAAGAHEWARLCRLAGAGAWAYAAAASAVFAVLFVEHERAAWAPLMLSALFWVIAAPLWLGRGVREGHRLALAAAGFVVIVPAGLALALLEPAEVLAVLVLVWIADTAAYFVGRSFGRRKLAPSISPGKTWEGAAGGIGGALLYAILLGVFWGKAWWAYLVIALVLAALSIVGDLFESAAKRQAGVKDSGTLLPGHGGIMDRIDSATATLPVAALLLSLPNP
jgi:phosphatidate cytidylyltransferase